MKRFRDLQNYTTLKHKIITAISYSSFRDLQNYTTLKPLLSKYAIVNEF